MQTEAGLHRVASECVQDLAADGVVYAEIRYAPEQHLLEGLTLEQVVEAVNAGFRHGERAAAAAGHRIRVTALLTAMRHAAKSTEIARLVVHYRDEGVSGFDIAGAEAGFPPTRHLDAFEYLRRENAHFTIHAGEAFGLPSIWEAIQWCGADRLGHGVRIVDDIRVGGVPYADDVAAAAVASPDDVELGLLAAYVRDRRIPLEMCPSSNVQTGAAESVALHPISLLKRLRFRVTVNTDNRLMSGTSMSREMSLLVERGRLDAGGPAVGDHQRDEVLVPAVRRAAGDHRRGGQAGLRRGARGHAGSARPGDPPAVEPVSPAAGPPGGPEPAGRRWGTGRRREGVGAAAAAPAARPRAAAAGCRGAAGRR